MLTASSPVENAGSAGAFGGAASGHRRGDRARRRLRCARRHAAVVQQGIDRSRLSYSRASASTGSSRAAERAGMKPKTMPISVEDSEGGNDRQRRIAEPRAGRGTAVRPTPSAQRDAGGAADEADQHRLDQELPHDVAAPRADRHAHADLARPLGHRHQHDVHHPDAADDQRDHGDQPRSAASASGWSTGWCRGWCRCSAGRSRSCRVPPLQQVGDLRLRPCPCRRCRRRAR